MVPTLPPLPKKGIRMKGWEMVAVLPGRTRIDVKKHVRFVDEQEKQQQQSQQQEEELEAGIVAHFVQLHGTSADFFMCTAVEHSASMD